MDPTPLPEPVNGHAAPAFNSVREGTLRPARDIWDSPYSFQAKSVTRWIRNLCEATRDVSSGLALYLGLSEIASDEGMPTFTRRVAEIATFAGLKYRKAEILLARFEQAGLIHVQRNFMAGTQSRLPNTYTLLAFGIEDATSRNDCGTCRTELNASCAESIEQRNIVNKPSPTGEEVNGAVRLSKPRKVKGNNLPDLPPELNAQADFAPAWAEFQAHRAELNKPLTPTAAKRLLATLAQRPAQAAALLALAVEKGWRGFAWEWFDNARIPRRSALRPGTPTRPASRPPEHHQLADPTTAFNQ